jgi:pilus assembly protein CpaD
LPTAQSVRRRRLLLNLAGSVALAAASAACTSNSTALFEPEDQDYRQRHPIMISEEPEVFEMTVGMNGPALSPEIETAIRDYVDEYRLHGTGAITIQVPTNSANEVAAGTTGRAVHYALVRAGVPQGRIVVAPYHVGDHSRLGSLRLSYLRVKAVAPRCGVWPEGSESDFRNSQLHNFGCAYQQNLAAMVDNPADLVRPRPMDPANGARRANVITTYAETGNTGWTPQPETRLLGRTIGDF